MKKYAILSLAFTGVFLTAGPLDREEACADLTVLIDKTDQPQAIRMGMPVYAPKLGPVEIAFSQGALNVVHDGQTHPVARHDMCEALRKVKPHELRAFLNHGGQLHVRRLSDGSFKVSTRTPGPGGGPLLAAAGGILVRAVAYGGIAAAVGASLPATGPGMAVSGGLAEGMALANMAGTGTTMAATGISYAGGGSVAASTMGATAASGASASGVFGAIEGGANYISALLAVVPGP